MKTSGIITGYFIAYGAVKIVEGAHAITKSGNPSTHWLFTGNMPFIIICIAFGIELLSLITKWVKKRMNEPSLNYEDEY